MFIILPERGKKSQEKLTVKDASQLFLIFFPLKQSQLEWNHMKKGALTSFFFMWEEISYSHLNPHTQKRKKSHRHQVFSSILTLSNKRGCSRFLLVFVSGWVVCTLDKGRGWDGHREAEMKRRNFRVKKVTKKTYWENFWEFVVIFKHFCSLFYTLLSN